MSTLIVCKISFYFTVLIVVFVKILNSLSVTLDSTAPKDKNHSFVIELSDMTFTLPPAAMQALLCIVNAITEIQPVSNVVQTCIMM